MCQRPIQWANHGYKHFPSRSIPWKKLVHQTANRGAPSLYLPSLNLSDVQRLEEAVAKTGIEIISDERHSFLYKVFPEPIGASKGSLTNIIRVQWDADGTLHGYPVSEIDLIDELKEYGEDRVTDFLNAKSTAEQRNP